MLNLVRMVHVGSHSVHHAKPAPTQHVCSYFHLQIMSQDLLRPFPECKAFQTIREIL